MTNGVALAVLAVIVVLLAADALLFGWGLPILLMEQVARLTAWMAFWR